MKWLYIYGVDGLSVSGGGTIDGSGQQWWASTCKRKKTPPCYSGPRPKVNAQLPHCSSRRPACTCSTLAARGWMIAGGA